MVKASSTEHSYKHLIGAFSMYELVLVLVALAASSAQMKLSEFGSEVTDERIRCTFVWTVNKVPLSWEIMSERVNTSFPGVNNTLQFCIPLFEGPSREFPKVSCNAKDTIEHEATFIVDWSDAVVQLNCSARFPLEISWEHKFNQLETFGLYYQNTESGIYSVNLRVPAEGETLVFASDVFSNNYTFFSKHSHVNRTIRFYFTYGISPDRDEFSSLAGTAEGRLKMTMNNEGFTCSSLRYDYAGTVRIYMAIVTGRNPTESIIRERCLPEEASCTRKQLGKPCSGTFNSCKEITLFPPHGTAYCTLDEDVLISQYFTSVDGYTVIQNLSHSYSNENVIRLRRDDKQDSATVHGTDSQNVASEPTTFYETEAYSFECIYVDYFLIPPITWIIQFRNGSERVIVVDFGANVSRETIKYIASTNSSLTKEVRLSSSHVQIAGVLGMASIKCIAGYWNSLQNATATRPVNIKSITDSAPPKFEEGLSTHIADLGFPLKLNCTVSHGRPSPEYVWHFESQNKDKIRDIAAQTKVLNGSSFSFRSGSIWKTESFGADMEGVFVCTAKNFRGNARRTFKVHIREGKSPWLPLSISAGVIIILMIILILLFRKYYLQKGQLSAMEIERFTKGNVKEVKSENFTNDNAQFLPYNRDYEVPWKNLEMDEEKLGEGAYGIVFKGRFINDPSRTIAVKTAKPGVDKGIILALLSELKVMIHLGKHDNVVELLGACTEYLRRGRVYIMVEYCPMGSLESFLRENRYKFKLNQGDTVCHGYENVCEQAEHEEENTPFGIQTLVNWAIQIARGMQHLESKKVEGGNIHSSNLMAHFPSSVTKQNFDFSVKVIHGDLATRNVLLFTVDCVKITDFGLSRQLLNYDEYQKKSQDKLPWRWLALETLKTLVFSHKSDVWSYGVTIWEMLSLGLVPYPGMIWTPDFLTFLENDLRLSQPEFSPNGIYELMVQCWDAEPKNRPDFQKIEEILSQSILLED